VPAGHPLATGYTIPYVPVTIELSVADLAGTRFAVSPLSETISSLQMLGFRDRRETTRRWRRWAEDELAARPLVLPRSWPLLVNDRASWPQFLFPAPGGPGTTIDEDLAALRRTPARDVRTSLHRVFGDDLPDSAASLAAHPAAGLRAIAAELREAHDRLVAPHWDRIRAVLDADIAYRARQLATGGAERLFADLHPDLRWQDGKLVASRDRPVEVGPGGLVLLPVVLGPAAVLIKGRTSTRTTLRYPARGVGTLWTAGTRPAPGSTVRLLGRHRAALLEALRSPATTADLARALGVTPSAVAQHLAILRDSGLVTGERLGRTVLYATTPRGLTLLDPPLLDPSSPGPGGSRDGVD
jgi:DNA-binding transcriptional ArsR family regulator